jgi:hypothetical protein
MKTVSKTFAAALDLFYKDIRKFKRYLDDKRINAAEKAILQSWLYLRDNQFKEAHYELSKISQMSDEFVSGQKQLIEGIIFFNQGELVKALPHLQMAYKFLSDTPCDNQKMIVLSNLFNLHLNLNHPKEMKEIISKMEDLECTSIDAKIRLLRSQFNYFSYSEQFQFARSVLLQLNSLKNSMNENQRIFFLVDLFDFQVKEGKFSEAKSTLGEMKNYRKFHLTQNFNYMKALIGFLTEDQKFYIYEQDFETHQFLFFQLKVIESLSLKDHVQAEVYWLKLSSLFPQTYSRDFNYHGDKCLFSLCIDKLMNHHAINKNQPTLKDDGTQECRVIQELHKQSVLKKEDLYHLLYGEFPQDKSDLQKLAKVISRAREKYGLSIKTNKGCYELVKIAQAS